MSSMFTSATPSVGQQFFFPAIIAVYLGSIFLKDGIPNLWGTVVASLFLAVLSNGFNLIGLMYWHENLAQGLLMILSISVITKVSKKDIKGVSVLGEVERENMLPRDCVLTSIGHQVPDRLPIIIGGTAGKFYRSTTLALMAHFGIPEEKAELVQTGFKYVLHCDELMKKLGSSVLFLYPQNHSEDLLRAQNTLGGEFVNKWGSTFKFMDEDGEKPLLESNVSLKEAVLETLARHSWPKTGAVPD